MKNVFLHYNEHIHHTILQLFKLLTIKNIQLTHFSKIVKFIINWVYDWYLEYQGNLKFCSKTNVIYFVTRIIQESKKQEAEEDWAQLDRQGYYVKKRCLSLYCYYPFLSYWFIIITCIMGETADSLILYRDHRAVRFLAIYCKRLFQQASTKFLIYLH